MDHRDRDCAAFVERVQLRDPIANANADTIARAHVYGNTACDGDADCFADRDTTTDCHSDSN